MLGGERRRRSFVRQDPEEEEDYLDVTIRVPSSEKRLVLNKIPPEKAQYQGWRIHVVVELLQFLTMSRIDVTAPSPSPIDAQRAWLAETMREQQQYECGASYDEQVA